MGTENKTLEQILNKLDTMQSDINDLKQGQEKMQSSIAVIQSDIAVMQSDIGILKEDSEITRNATNALLEWAERVGEAVEIKLSDVV